MPYDTTAAADAPENTGAGPGTEAPPVHRRARRLRPEDRREQILSCAIRLFGTRPYSQVSVGEIADEAGVRRPLVHHYFGDKQRLFVEAVRRFTVLPEFDPGALADCTTVDERIDTVVSQWLTQAARHPGLWLQVVGAEGMSDFPGLREVLEEADAVAASQLLQAVAPDRDVHVGSALHSMTIAYGAMLKSASRLWLEDRSIEVDELRAVLVATMTAILEVDIRTT